MKISFIVKLIPVTKYLCKVSTDLIFDLDEVAMKSEPVVGE